MITRIQSVILGLVSLIIISSCNSALDRDPLTEYSAGNFWNERSQASAALAGAYFRLQNTLNQEFILYGEARADILSLTRDDNVQNFSLVYNRLNPDMPVSDWSNFYSVIGQANLIIRNVKIMREKGIYPITANETAEYNRVLGQALGLRALCYFYMTRIWGNVPLIAEPVANNGDITAFKMPRTDTSEINKLISADLTEARELLPVSYGDNRKNRATLTRGGIDAIMTDYYMWRNNMDSALVTAKRITDNTTNYKLAALYDPAINYFDKPQTDIDNTEYAKMFLDGFSQESIFELAFSYDEGTTSGLLSYFGGGAGTAQFFANPTFASSFGNRDLRYRADIKSDEQIFKMFPKGDFNKTTDNDKNVILYRLADIILLRGEAFLMTGNRANAWAQLKRVRERTFGPPSASNPYNNNISGPTGSVEENRFMGLPLEEARDVILEERKKELCFEGKRWFDLVRTGRAISTMQPINGLSDPENILFPINLNIIRQNPLIEQNNFYK